MACVLPPFRPSSRLAPPALPLPPCPTHPLRLSLGYTRQAQLDRGPTGRASRLVAGRHEDWWALGVLGYELLTGRSPWTAVKDKAALRREILTKPVGRATIVKRCTAALRRLLCARRALPSLLSLFPEALRPPCAGCCSSQVVLPKRCGGDEAQRLLSGLLFHDYFGRLGTARDAEVAASPFFGRIDWPRVRSRAAPPALVPSALVPSVGVPGVGVPGGSAASAAPRGRAVEQAGLTRRASARFGGGSALTEVEEDEVSAF